MSCELPFAVAVLAGGASTRMGRDKALIVHEGRTLLERQVALAWQLGPQEVFVAGRTQVELGALRAVGLPDAQPGQGPLGGLATVLAATPAAHVLVLAVDMPLLGGELLGRLLAARTAGSGVVPRNARGWEPTAAVYPRALAAVIDTVLASGRRSLQAVVAEGGRRGLLVDWPVAPADAACFANWNTPADLAPGSLAE